MSAAEDYRTLLHALLRRRWAEGPLGDPVEAEYAGRFEDLWEAMTPDEQEAHERWLKDSRLHAVVFQETDPACPGWVARTLGYDFIGESATKRGAIENLAFAIQSEVGHFAIADTRGPFEELARPPRRFVEWAVGRLIARIMLHGTKGDDLLLIEHERQPETWTLYVLDLD
jgi:hypothetical protein